jgi:hypothetical protein
LNNPSSLWLWVHLSLFLPLLTARVVQPTQPFLIKAIRAVMFALVGYHVTWIVSSYFYSSGGNERKRTDHRIASHSSK